MLKTNKTERVYINRLFELKPDCTGRELLNLFEWMNTKDLKGFDEHFHHVRDKVILNEAIRYEGWKKEENV